MIRDNIKKLRHAADVLEEATNMVKRLRRAADALEALQSDNPFAEPTIARAIEERVEKNLNGVGRPTAKGYKYRKGTHWTQRPENKGKLAQAVRRVHAEKGHTLSLPVAAVADTRQRKYAPGQHWTQRPENKAKLQKLLRKAARSRKQTPSPSSSKES